MDENTAIKIISESENKIRELTEERNNYSSLLVNYQAFIDKIPKNKPGDLNSDSMTPLEWLDWALKTLGYEEKYSTED